MRAGPVGVLVTEVIAQMMPSHFEDMIQLTNREAANNF
jgi:hypothetical protein